MYITSITCTDTCVYVHIYTWTWRCESCLVRSLPGSSSRAEVLGGASGFPLVREAHQCQYVGQKPYWFNEEFSEENAASVGE